MAFFAIQAATDAQLLRRSCESLVGICSGLLADGRLDDQEILFLDNWLAEHSAIANTWPGEVLYERIRAILADGVIDKKEREYLLETIKSIIGGTLAETGALDGPSTDLPINDVVGIDFSDKSFCFTGQFLFGTRDACHRATERAGGVAAPRITKSLHYLVIGTLSSRACENASFGRKIEKAVDYQKDGRPLLILSEAQWVGSLPQST